MNLMNYPGSAEGNPEARENAGSKPLVRPQPLIKVDDIAYVLFEKPDLDKQAAFLQDFGMRPADISAQAIYMRGCGSSPWFYRATRGKKSRYLGAGFLVKSAEELHTISAATDTAIEAITKPGGGQRVRLLDPDGFIVDIVHGREELARQPTRDRLFDVNTPAEKKRVNQRVSTAAAPSPLERLGHLVLATTNFATSVDWYMRHLGVIASDVQCVADGSPVLAFTRCDRGDTPRRSPHRGAGTELRPILYAYRLRNFRPGRRGTGLPVPAVARLGSFLGYWSPHPRQPDIRLLERSFRR